MSHAFEVTRDSLSTWGPSDPQQFSSFPQMDDAGYTFQIDYFQNNDGFLNPMRITANCENDCDEIGKNDLFKINISKFNFQNITISVWLAGRK